MAVIDLYSDTHSLPTEAMFEAARRAPLGDDVAGTDPTVNRLQDLAAERFGFQAALFMPSGTMGNLVALMAHGGHGDEIFVAEDAHIYVYESGGLASVAGYVPRVLPPCPGFMDPDALADAIRPANVHHARQRVVALENTHNLGGGSVMKPTHHARLCETAHAHGMKVHLDGARIFNAALALGCDVRDLVAGADTVMFCLSKGLSCPAGSLLLGDRETIDEAIRIRKRLGGTMRQSGVLAAMGIVAIETLVDRLADDHANARRLDVGLQGIPGLEVDADTVQTNMVYCALPGLSGHAASERLLKAGVHGTAMADGRVRFVTYRGITAEDIDRAIALISREMNATDGAGS